LNLIRPYRQTDQQSVLNLFQSNTPEYFDFSEKVELLDYLNHKLEDYFVVEQNGVVIGSGGINYFYEEKKARLSWDIVSPQSQGKGVGTVLTHYRLNLIKRLEQIQVIEVRTSQFSNGFYLQQGFRIKSIEKDYWASGFDLYLMEYYG